MQALEAAELSRVKSASETPSSENGNWGGEPRAARPSMFESLRNSMKLDETR